MKYIDIKPGPIGYIDEIEHWANDFVSRNCSVLGKKIEVIELESDNNWSFAYLDYGNGKKGFAVF